MIGDFQFLTPVWLLLTLPVFTLIWAYLRFHRSFSMWSQVCDEKFLQLLQATPSKKQRPSGLCVLLFSLASISIVALAGPSWQKQDYPVLQSAAARVLLLDLSSSMLVEDVKPNRLELAIDFAVNIIDSDFDGETALVVFAGAAFVVSPLTRDHNTLLEFIKALNPGTMPIDGNRLDLAIDQALILISASITKTGQIIALTDGVSDIDKAIVSAREASNQGSQVSLLTIGTTQGAPMKNAEGGLLRNKTGGFILAAPNFKKLESVTLAGTGKMLRHADFKDRIDTIANEFETSNLRPLQDRDRQTEAKAENGGIWLVWLMIPFALLLFRQNLFWVLMLAFVVPIDKPLYALELESLWKNDEQLAYQAFRNGNYQLTEKLSSNPALLGTALFQRQQYDLALEYFVEDESAHSFYNRASVYIYLQQFDEALEAYQKALEIDPDYSQAIFNKAWLESFLAEKTNAIDTQNMEDGDTSEPSDATESESDQSRIGQSQLQPENRDASNQAGFGMSTERQQGQIVEEEFSAIDVTLEQFLLRPENADFEPDPEAIRLWTESLTSDPAELFRRKFLREFQRNNIERR